MDQTHIPDDIAAMGLDQILDGLHQIRDRSNFAYGLTEQAKQRPLTDAQIAGARRTLAWARRRDGRSSTEIDLAPIREMFERARSSGHTRPIYRAEDLVLRRAPDGGKNPGAIYVKTDNGNVYQGKLIGTIFTPDRHIYPETIPALRRIAANPHQAAVEHGRRTGRCACCGRPLSDPESVAAGIGPYCAKKWGLA